MIRVKYKHLLGRPFVYGSTDCYGLARDFYRDNWGLELTDYARPDGWSDDGQNLLLDNITNEGFKLVHDESIRKIQPGDALLVALRSATPNHIGIYLGDSLVLHHYQGQLSGTHTLSGIFRNMVCAQVRNPLCVLPEEQTTAQLIDLIPEHKRAEILNAINRNKPESISPNSERQTGEGSRPEGWEPSFSA